MNCFFTASEYSINVARQSNVTYLNIIIMDAGAMNLKECCHGCWGNESERMHCFVNWSQHFTCDL